MNTEVQMFLLPVGASSQCEAVSNAFGAIGYAVEQLGPDDLPAVTLRRPYDPLVLLLGPGGLQQDPLLRLLATRNKNPSFLVIEGSDARLDESIFRLGHDFVYWPCQREELALRMARLISHRPAPPAADPGIAEEFVAFNLVGQSEKFLNLLARIKKIAQCDAPVLLEGQTGTGKELAARAIHYLSDRRDFPFIPINCGALPDSLIENELFGHAKGAYTDAGQAQTGVVEQAQGGTLFLDEVDALTQKAQVTLLRFLQDQRYRPLGERVLKEADVRIIAVSNRPLEELVTQGLFRQDLLFRLNVLNASLPPLRERGDDAVILAREFMRRLRIRYDQPDKILHPSTLRWIRRYDWPGNVRELENFIHREFLLSEGRYLYAQPPDPARRERRRARPDRRRQVSFDLGFADAKGEVITNFEKTYLCWLMEECGGNVTLAAMRAGKERRAIGKLLKKHGIDKKKYHRAG